MLLERRMLAHMVMLHYPITNGLILLMGWHRRYYPIFDKISSVIGVILAMQNSSNHKPLFGIGISPSVAELEQQLALVDYVDEAGLDLISIQDHPYNSEFLDTWTLLSVIGGRTKHIRLMPNVANLPLRPPAMLAKAAASLDILTSGRVELGLGVGAFWDAIVSYGGPRHKPGEAVDAFIEAVAIMRAIWTDRNQASYAGTYYQLNNARTGPAPAHAIGIWVGALKPRMLRLTGQLADGWIISSPRIPPEQVPELNALIDKGAEKAGRSPSAIRRGYNVAGAIVNGNTIRSKQKGIIIGGVDHWVTELTHYYRHLRMDLFNFSPINDGDESQIRLFTEQVVPATRAALGFPEK